ncbi:MAG: FAD/NAD(P)-binding protein [Dehalococcoidales bacterium]|nr:FAD/NAD(P)-binding protein [Dehalococcoidales bacterium]
MKNPYLPVPAKIEKVVVETDDSSVKTFHLSIVSKDGEGNFNFIPGQFAELSILGKGEAPFGMAAMSQPGHLEFTVSRAGVVTTALHNLESGEMVGVRGPLGNGYPIETLKGQNIVMIGGGFGFSTLRALTHFLIDETNRSSFGEITIIYGARRPGLLLYRDDLEQWGERTDLNLHLTVDTAAEGWAGHVGFVPAITKEVAPDAKDAYAIVCGPPAMIKFTLPVLNELGFSPEKILLSLEMRMKCGVGMCGRCNIGSLYVCRDGPVFSYEQLLSLNSDEF